MEWLAASSKQAPVALCDFLIKDFIAKASRVNSAVFSLKSPRTCASPPLGSHGLRGC